MDLHGQIMNIPCDVARMDMNSPSEVMAYRLGHRDARHAAAELATTAAALSQPAAAGVLTRVNFVDDVNINGVAVKAGTVWNFAAPKATP